MFIVFAVGGSDYTAVDQVVTLTQENPSSCVDIPIHPDDVFEMNETFTLRLTSDVPTITLQPDESTVTIINDDGMSRMVICLLP